MTTLILTVGCKNQTTEKISNIDALKVEQDKQTKSFTYYEYKSDSLTIDIKNDNFNFTLLLRIGDLSKAYDLNKLNIPIKTTELVWINKDYACMVTWWSQAQSRHIFIPTKQANEFIYFDKDIEETDSINNNIVYVDSVFYKEDKAVFKVENLLTRKSKSLEFSINEQNCIYPFYDKITLTKNKLTMTTANEKKSIGIKEISSNDSIFDD